MSEWLCSPLTWNHGFECCAVELDGDGALDRNERYDEARRVFASDDDALETREETAAHTDAPADLQKSMRLRAETVVEAYSNTSDIFIGQRRCASPKADNVRDAGNLENAQSILQCQVHKDIAGEQRQLQTHLAIFPLSQGFVLRKKVFDAAAAKLIGDPALPVRAGVERVPARLGVICESWAIGNHPFVRLNYCPLDGHGG